MFRSALLAAWVMLWGGAPCADAKQLRIAGSSTVFPVADAWVAQLASSNYTFELNGGGSSSGARRVCSPPDDPEHVDIGDMSRQWKSSEAQLLDDDYTYECLATGRRVTQLTVAVDGLAVAVQRGGAADDCISNVLHGVTLAQLRWMFTDWSNAALAEDGVQMASVAPNDNGNGVKEWSDLHASCQQVPINTYGAGDQSGTHEFFGEHVFCKNCFKGKDGYTPEYFRSCSSDDIHWLEAMEHDTAAAFLAAYRGANISNCYFPSEDDDKILHWLYADTGGIAYFGFAHYAGHAGALTALAIASDRERGVADTQDALITPTSETIIDGSYSAFTRALYMNVDNEVWPLVEEFLLHGFSAEGQQAVDGTGYVTVNQALRAKMMQRIEEGGNPTADYVPRPPDSCPNGTGLTSSDYVNQWGTPKVRYGCEPCAPGSAKASSEASACDACLEGFFTAAPGQKLCQACLPGSFSLAGAAGCTECERNEYQALPGQSSCLHCGAGSFTASAGQSRCEPCPRGTFLQQGNETCQACPAGMTTDLKGSMTRESCKCAAGSYLAAGADPLVGPCLPCPAAMTCPFGSSYANFWNATTKSLKEEPDESNPFPMVQEGYMTRPAAVLKAFKCGRPDHCPGGAPGSCGAHRDPNAVACGRCEENAYEVSEMCSPCVGTPWTIWLVTSVLAVCGLVAMTLIVNKKLLMTNDTHMMVVIMCSQMFLGVQTLNIFRMMSIKWFEPLLTMLSVVKLLSFDLQLLRVECMSGSSPVLLYAMRQLVAPMGIPFVLITLLTKKYRKPDTRIFIEFTNTVGTVYQIFFISIVLSATVPLVRYQHPAGHGASVRSEPSILVGESSQFTQMLTVSLLALFLIPIPFFAASLYATKLFPILVAQHGTRQGWCTLDSFRWLFFRFKAERYYFGVCVLARNACMCLVPVFIAFDVALQVIVMAVLIATLIIIQQQWAPWRANNANWIDGVCSMMILMLLVCGALTADLGSAGPSSIEYLGTAFFCAFFMVGVVSILFALYLHFRPQRYYDKFICHHKADAAAQARLLKMLLTKRANLNVFIDSDDLQELDELFETVKRRTEHVIVYLSKETLNRTWCAGEIVTAFKHEKRVTAVITPSFQPPTEEDLCNVDELLDLGTLEPYDIGADEVRSSFQLLLSKECQHVELRQELYGSFRFLAVVDELLGGKVKQPSGVDLADMLNEMGMVLVSSEPGNDEATAAAQILVRKIERDVCHSMRAGICCLSDCKEDPRQSRHLSRTKQAVSRSRAVLTVLSPGTLASIEQITVIWEAMASIQEVAESGGIAPAMVPILTPGFVFPLDDFYEVDLAAMVPAELLVDAEEKIRAFFNYIAVSLPTSASDQILDTQAREILGRIPRTMGKSSSSGKASPKGHGHQKAQFPSSPSSKDLRLELPQEWQLCAERAI